MEHSGREFANFIVTSGLVHQAWAAIEEQEEINPDAEMPPYNKIRKLNPTVIVFGTPRVSFKGKEGLISSYDCIAEHIDLFEFFYKRFPDSSFNELAMSIFLSNYNEINLLRKELVGISSRKSSIIITGRSVGGCVAILFTLWLLDCLNHSRTIHPICITFGSPLLGDVRLQKYVSQVTTWESCFLHIASYQDHIPKFFLSQNPSGTYKPFGAFLLCSATSCDYFEEPELILEWLAAATPQSFQSQDPDIGQQLFNYGKMLEGMEVIGLSRDDNNDMELIEGEINPFQVMTERKNDSYFFKDLAEMKRDMAILETFMKKAKVKKIGLYDLCKNDYSVVHFCKELMNYWEKSVAKEEFKPHTEDDDLFWNCWLLAATSYRRMVEPLHIANYYNNSEEDYIAHGRPHHFVLLEQWWNEKEKPEASQNNAWIKREVAACRLNEDSCFWAHVEEAIISCNVLKSCKEGNVQNRECLKLKEFEGYVYDAINRNQVSLDIFLEGSSFRQWWNKYEAIKGSSYCSSLMRKFWEGMGAPSSPGSSFPTLQVKDLGQYTAKDVHSIADKSFSATMLTPSSPFSSSCSEEIETQTSLSEEEDRFLTRIRNMPDIEEAVTLLRKITGTKEDARVHLCSPRILVALSTFVASSYENTQANSVATLLNLSLEMPNKFKMVGHGVIPPLLGVLEAGSPEAQEHAAGVMFSLALSDECKMVIGVLGALPPLLHLLNSENERTRHYSALALYHLTLVEFNQVKLIKIGAVPLLLKMVKRGHMVDQVLLTLCNISTSPHGKKAMLDSDGVECLVDVLREKYELDTMSTHESSVTALYFLCRRRWTPRFEEFMEVNGALEVLKEVNGALEVLKEVVKSGTERARVRAKRLEMMVREELMKFYRKSPRVMAKRRDRMMEDKPPKIDKMKSVREKVEKDGLDLHPEKWFGLKKAARLALLEDD